MARQRRSSRSPRGASPASFGLFAGVAGLALWALLRYGVGWTFYGAWLGAWSLTAAAFFAYDKAQAQAGGWRVPEIVLHGLTLVGGFLGSLVSMIFLRHKTQHGIFWAMGLLAILAHVGLYIGGFVR